MLCQGCKVDYPYPNPDRIMNGELVCDDCLDHYAELLCEEPNERPDTTRKYSFLIPKRPMKRGN
jgi:hypothetical protein